MEIERGLLERLFQKYLIFRAHSIMAVDEIEGEWANLSIDPAWTDDELREHIMEIVNEVD